MSEADLRFVVKYLEKNLSRSFICCSTYSAGSPILLVKNGDGSIRLCVDYRGLNAMIIKTRYRLPLIQETLERLNGAKIFTKLDLRGAFNLFRIAEGEEWKIAFISRLS